MPGSRSVCFVCGSVGAELRLHSKPRDQGPYFPFLDHHEPPKASRLPGPDGVVDSCRVCYAFLTQQWETYERSKTPAIKRLYWLKRTDELTFTGAEMKLQGEYMAQVMGLQYQPNCHDNCSNAPVSPDDRRAGSSGYNNIAGGGRDAGGYSASGGAVHDGGSVPGGISSGQPRSHHNSGVDPQAVAHMRAAESEGALDLTVPSKSSDNHMDVSSARFQNVSGFRDLIVCFTCACELYVMNSKVVSSVRISASDPHFPFLEKMTPTKGAVPLSSQGLTRVCEGCFSSLCQQWLAYERACTPGSARIYKIKDKYFDVSQTPPVHQPLAVEHLPEVNKARVRAEEACYLCGQVRPQNQICPLHTVPPADKKVHMYFPFIRELRRPHGAQPLNPDGTVLVCTTCNSNLQAQWQHYEAESVPLMHRRYSLLPVSSTPMHLRIPDAKNSISRTESPRIGGGGHGHRRKSGEGRNEGVDVHQPLNIQISKSPVLSSSSSAHGLLAIAPQTPRSITGDVSSASLPALVMSEMAASGLNSRPSDLPRGTGLSSSASTSAITSVPHPLQQATTLPKKVCFLCGEKCLLSKAHLLYSYPVRHEAKSATSAQSVPFFPFLANREPASGSEPMTDEGTVISCNYCYHSLVSQWKDFEDSKYPADSNRWLRKYTVRDFVCYVCGMTVSRRKIRTLEVHKFHFLKEHKAPLSALVLDTGEAVAACDSCTFSLTHQFAEYERMGVPMDLRKYNWTTAPVSEENSQDNSDQSGEERWRRAHFSNEDSNHSVTEAGPDGDDPPTGLGQGSKPPALNMLSPASGKMTPKTATVPPLSQASPSNGLTSGGSNSALNATRTSSFAAALRKLAYQAKDPQEEAAVLAAAAKHNGSPINSTSPRSTTPKRAPPPLVYSGHNANLSSPPVVTIAPTQSLNLSNDGRQSNERVPSAHSTASSYDHYSMKHERERERERDQRPHSSHSKDEDRASVKDSVSLSQTPTRLVHPQSTAATSREESLTRGFHPYRPEDDLQRAAAAAAAVLPPPFGLDPAYAYHPAFLQPHPYSHPALRFEDPLLLERYRLMQAAPFMPFPPAGLVPHPGVHPLLSGARYPADLLHQYPYISPGAQGLDHRSPQVSADRSKSEDDRVRELEREREKEKREKEREREREREREAEAKREKLREMEREREKQRSVEHGERRDILTVPSRYINDRDGDHREGRSHHHHHHPHHHGRDDSSSHSGKSGSISHGTPRDADGSRSNLPSLGGSHNKNHISSNSTHNSYHHKYDNHLFPKQDRVPSESSHSSYNHSTTLGEVEQSKGQPPPPLVSPHRSSSKGSGESAIFRPFEKDGPANSASAAVSLSCSNKTQDVLSVPPLHVSGAGEEKCNGGSSTKSGKDNGGLYSQHTSAVRVFGSTPEAKIINSNYINHRVERFDFKSLARECTAGTGESGKSVSDLSGGSLAAHPPPLAPVPEPVAPVVSRLDLKERRLLEARASDNYNSESEDEADSDEEEDQKRERLTVVDSALPLELEVTPGKLGLMDALGLSTLQRKKDLQCRLFRKRRRLMRERSVSPVEMEDGESGDIDLQTSTLGTPTIDPALLTLEPDYQEKCGFLLTLGIIPLSPERRKELEALRRACEDCKRRRVEKRKKRSRCGQEHEDDVLVALGLAHGGDNSRSDELDRSNNSLGQTIEPLRITLGQLQERHLAAARQQQQKNHIHPKLGADGSRPVIFPESQSRQLSREFAEQFHESVLQSTRQKELSHKSAARSGEGHGGDAALRGGQDGTARLHLSNDHLHSSSTSRSGDGPRPVYPWPGIEGVLESYLRHREEERMEAQVLLDRCRQLHAEKSELHKVAESLNQRMRVLHQELAARDTERQHTQSAIDNLKKCLRIYR